eukprot:7577577-Alexandrium_andersonii.AAC.1
MGVPAFDYLQQASGRLCPYDDALADLSKADTKTLAGNMMHLGVLGAVTAWLPSKVAHASPSDDLL